LIVMIVDNSNDLKVVVGLGVERSLQGSGKRNVYCHHRLKKYIMRNKTRSVDEGETVRSSIK